MLRPPEDFPRVQSSFHDGHPKTLRRNPISWYPGVGFFRNSKRDEILRPKSARSVSNVNGLAPLDAFRLGTGRGLASSLDQGHPIVDVATGLGATAGCDLELMARLGLTARLLPGLCDNQPAIHERIARFMCGVLGRAMMEDDEWRAILLRFAVGSDTEADREVIRTTDYANGKPFNYTAVPLAGDTFRDQTHTYFAGLKRFDGSVWRLRRDKRRTMLAETVEFFETLVEEAGAGVRIADS